MSQFGVRVTAGVEPGFAPRRRRHSGWQFYFACQVFHGYGVYGVRRVGAHRCGRAKMTQVLLWVCSASFDSARAQGAARGGF